MTRSTILCALLLIVAAPARAQTLAQGILAMHNAYRSKVSVPPVEWDDGLAAEAARWAAWLGQSGRLLHGVDARSEEGENLWIGSAGAFSPAQAVAQWGAEQAEFVPGVFPNVSRTGRLVTVAHYTQMVWRETRRVGCGLARAGPWDILVCRYSKPGNVLGQAAY